MHPSRFVPAGLTRVALARSALLLVGAVCALAACAADNSMTRSFGGGGAQPEDVRAGARPPLSLPPEFTLRPDRLGVVHAVPSGAAADTARVSVGQTALLDAAGPDAAPDIRAKVNADVQLETPDQGFTDLLMTWQRPTDQAPIIQRGPSKGLLGRIF